MKMNIKTVCVVGGGMMGRQIALNTAKYDFQVYVTDSNKDICEQAKAWAADYLDGRVSKGRMTQDEADAVATRFHVTDSLEEAAGNADLVIEAIFENEAAKHDIFKKLNAIAPKHAILATNSSTMVSSIFKDDVDDPSRVANLHYFNPALVMELTEVVKGDHTGEETAQALMDFSTATGKRPVLIRKAVEKFIVNRIISAIANEAYWLVENGYCTYEDIDIACEKGAGHKMGPFRSKDLTGIDRNFLMMQDEYDRTGKKPLGYDLFKEQYDKGRYGRKNGHGFYDYE
ncbi:MAG: 3-hydroxyacyl-CoA dehydrogenase family protein [Ruminococcaceae bacterium]|nr:3-hydroxyacyl-CoA dehydrogenase family protein [Oscillospiraceae bacterium]